MNAATLVADGIALSAQIGIIVAVAAVVAAIVRIDAASVRYQYWRAVLLLSIALPWLQRRQSTSAVVDTIGRVSLLTTTTVSIASGPVPSAGVPWLTLLLAAVVVGVVVRLTRMAIGLRRLRRLREAGYAAPPNAEHDEWQWALRTRAEIRYVPGGQPVTCGARRPVVLLPDTLPAHPLGIQRAVLVHELLHVQRRDWAWVMGEEVVRAVLWFHPAIWWLIARVRLAREEVVDELTVLATSQRRAYLEALLVFADAAPFAPTAAFARRHQLFRRMTLISKEAVMSSKRIVVSALVLAVAVIAGSWYAVAAFPLTQAPGAVQSAPQTASVGEAGPLERGAKAITPENPIPRRTYAVAPRNPGGADAPVLVSLRVTLNGLGRVAEVRSIGQGAVRLSWAGPDGRGRGAVGGVIGGPSPAPEAFVKAATDAVRQWIYDAPADAPIAFDVAFEFMPGADARLLSHGGPMGVRFATAPPPPPPPAPPAPGTTARPADWAPNAIRVGGQIRPPTKVKDVSPVYPPIAQSAHVQGVVILESLIGADGRVQDARVLRSIPLLDQAALDAVKQWEFTPTLLNGAPVPIVMTMTVQFTLTQ
jgi:TonB family protein